MVYLLKCNPKKLSAKSRNNGKEIFQVIEHNKNQIFGDCTMTIGLSGQQFCIHVVVVTVSFDFNLKHSGEL